jgi:Response regulators consisting of a CheY-like receiver domain and a winged-helix DNA-binding domain
MELWGDEEPESDALRSHIYNLRKMVDKPFEQKLIHTISGIGLKIAFEDEA